MGGRPPLGHGLSAGWRGGMQLFSSTNSWRPPPWDRAVGGLSMGGGAYYAMQSMFFDRKINDLSSSSFSSCSFLFCFLRIWARGPRGPGPYAKEGEIKKQKNKVELFVRNGMSHNFITTIDQFAMVHNGKYTECSCGSFLGFLIFIHFQKIMCMPLKMHQNN